MSYQPERVLPAIQQGLRAFLSARRHLKISPGSGYWSRDGSRPFSPPDDRQPLESPSLQFDVVAAGFQNCQLLVDECKWGADKVDRAVVRELVEQKTALLHADLLDAGQGWTTHFALLTRARFTPAAWEDARRQNIVLVGVARLDQKLG